MPTPVFRAPVVPTPALNNPNGAGHSSSAAHRMLTPRQLHLTSLSVPRLGSMNNNGLPPTEAVAPVVPVQEATLPQAPIVEITSSRDAVMREAPQLEEGEVPHDGKLYTFATSAEGKRVLVQVAQPVRSSPAEHIARAKMPAPPKFGGMLDSTHNKHRSVGAGCATLCTQNQDTSERSS